MSLEAPSAPSGLSLCIFCFSLYLSISCVTVSLSISLWLLFVSLYIFILVVELVVELVALLVGFWRRPHSKERRPSTVHQRCNGTHSMALKVNGDQNDLQLTCCTWEYPVSKLASTADEYSSRYHTRFHSNQDYNPSIPMYKHRHVFYSSTAMRLRRT